MSTIEIIITLVVTIVGSSGLWTFATTLYLKRHERKSLTNKLLLGLGHDKIIYLSEKYIERGWITTEEYENLHDYLFIPYQEMGGNGTAAKLMGEVKSLPTKKPIATFEDKQIRMDI